MGVVVNKSFKKVRKDIFKKAEKILLFLEEHKDDLQETNEWTVKQNAAYEKIGNLCLSLYEEVSNLDEIEIPDYKKSK